MAGNHPGITTHDYAKRQRKQVRVNKKNVVAAGAGKVEALKPFGTHEMDRLCNLLALLREYKIVKFNRNLPEVDDISKGREQFQFRPFNIQLQKVNRFEVLFGKELLERDDRDRYRIRVIPVG